MSILGHDNDILHNVYMHIHIYIYIHVTCDMCVCVSVTYIQFLMDHIGDTTPTIMGSVMGIQ